MKDRLLDPLTRAVPAPLGPAALSTLALAAALASAAAAWQQVAWLAVALWLLSRLADGLDGTVARHRGVASDFGGYVDIVFDTIGYAAIPIGVAAGVDTRAAWVTVSVLLGTFFVNAVSWTYVAAVIEKRSARSTHRVTTVTMPRGLVEGTETIVFFTVALAAPSIAVWVFAVMAVTVAITVAERLHWARSVLA